MDSGLLVVRLVFGLLMAAHGAQKLFGWFGGYGLTGTGQFFESLGFRPGRFFAALASGAEVLSGLLVALGLFGPFGPAIMLSVMIVGAITVHWDHGLFSQNSGIEVPLLYGTVATGLALIGYGRYSADALLALTPLWTPAVNWAALLVGVVGGFGNLGLRQPGPRQQVAA
jgi:putative oxidoreductase